MLLATEASAVRLREEEGYARLHAAARSSKKQKDVYCKGALQMGEMNGSVHSYVHISGAWLRRTIVQGATAMTVAAQKRNSPACSHLSQSRNVWVLHASSLRQEA